MAYFDLSKLNSTKVKVLKRSNPNCNGNRVIKWHWGPPALKCQIKDYQNKDKLSCSVLLLHRKPKLGRTKPSIGLHADRESRIGHSESCV